MYGICFELIQKTRKTTTWKPVGLGNPRILTDFAHKSLQTRMTGDLISWIKMNVSLQETNYEEADSSLRTPHFGLQLHIFLKAFGLRGNFLGARELGEE